MFSHLFEIFENEGEELFFVGGFVRDLLSARLSDDPAISAGPYDNEKKFWGRIKSGEVDVDFATSALPEKTIEILKKNKFKVIPIGKEFGTIQTYIDDQKIEITTYRCTESYKKGSRKPSVQFGKTLKEDLVRRDFTINAMAMDKNLKKIDYFNGWEDLVEGLLWSPDPSEGKSENPSILAFSDDPLRMLRAYRFEARGIAQCSWQVGDAIKQLKKEIHMVSAERVFDEFSKILMSKYAQEALAHMADSGLLGEVFPELQKVVDFKQNQGPWHSKLVWPHTLGVVQQSPQILEVRWAALFHDVAKPQTYSEGPDGVHFYGHDWKGSLIWDEVACRLKMSKEFRDHVHLLIYEHLQPSLLSSDGVNHCSDTALRRLVHRVGDKLDNLFDLSLADITSHKPQIVAEKRRNCELLRERIKNILAKDNIPKLKLPTGLGNVLMEKLGLSAGRELGSVMKQLSQKLIDGELSMQSDFVQEAKNILEKEKNG